jgi:hypothetical protein
MTACSAYQTAASAATTPNTWAMSMTVSMPRRRNDASGAGGPRRAGASVRNRPVAGAPGPPAGAPAPLRRAEAPGVLRGRGPGRLRRP